MGNRHPGADAGGERLLAALRDEFAVGDGGDEEDGDAWCGRARWCDTGRPHEVGLLGAMGKRRLGGACPCGWRHLRGLGHPRTGKLRGLRLPMAPDFGPDRPDRPDKMVLPDHRSRGNTAPVRSR